MSGLKLASQSSWHGREYVYAHRQLAVRLRIRTVTALYYGILAHNLRSERLGNLSPGEQVHLEWKVAFFKRVAQFVKMPDLFFSGKCHQVEVRIPSGVALYARTVRPDRDTWQVGPQQALHQILVAGGEVHSPFVAAGRFYSHISPVMAWYRSVASLMKASIRSRAALAFSPL